MTTNQQRLEYIQNRLEILNAMDNKIDAIISMLSDKRNSEPTTTFTPASNKASDKFIKEREMEIFQMLDKK